ncbi:EF-hand calcium-binding domain-containing protein 1-like [Venturia canescens]|uniref:EF-hand calcium-binding domain-containing protein 1-like n=1 Tax=Venturia canescens TaxID=32260 RepID=UPI001C9BD5C4|nr:EF-hand calcium-binding domain-containing protein 1-like [Venturia canescens]
MPLQLPTDILNDSLKEIVFLRKNQPRFKKLCKKTHFDQREIEALALIHRKIQSQSGAVTRHSFREVLHSGLDFTENIRHLLVDRLFSAMNKRNSSQLRMDHWDEGWSVLLRGNTPERIHFAYKVYDLMRTNKIGKEQIFPMMRGCLIKVQADEDPEEGVKDLIELMLKKLDVDRDGKVTEEDFKAATLQRNILFLECMGPVFPSSEAQNAFLTTFTTKTMW